MEYEIDPPHLGKDRTKTQEISESLSPDTKLRRRKNNNVKAIKQLNFCFRLHGRQMSPIEGQLMERRRTSRKYRVKLHPK